MSRWERIAREAEGEDYAASYADRFRAIAAEGGDIHGEAALVTALVAPPASVLDAGCGTGRIATHLATLGYDVLGVDADARMVDVARAEAPALDWRVADLAALATTDLGDPWDLVLVAGNVVPLLEPGSLDAVARGLAHQASPGGLVLCGYGLDADHLPGDCPVTPPADVDAAWARAGLAPVARWSTWDRAPWVEGDGYVVTLHRRGPDAGAAT